VQEAFQIQDNNLGTVLTTFGEVVPNFHTHVVFARDELIRSNADLVRRFLSGWFRVAAYMRDHKPETIQSVAATLRVSEKIVTETYDIEVGMMSFDGQFDPKALEVTRQSLKDLAILDFVPATSALYNGTFVPVKIN
jgi:ABC-type nitrate/sulfonate/bicarbonate transport system substrate-binding protein